MTYKTNGTYFSVLLCLGLQHSLKAIQGQSAKASAIKVFGLDLKINLYNAKMPLHNSHDYVIIHAWLISVLLYCKHALLTSLSALCYVSNVSIKFSIRHHICIYCPFIHLDLINYRYIALMYYQVLSH